MTHRQLWFKGFVSLIAAWILVPQKVHASDPFPTRNLTLIVPYTAGAGSDLVARLLAEELSAKLDKPVVVENRPGGSTLIAAAALTSAPPDGHTLLLGTSNMLAVNSSLYRKLPYDPIKSFQPVALVADYPFILLANSDLGIKTVPDLISRAKGSPKLTYATAGRGSPHHMMMELLQYRTGVKMTPIPYKGSVPALTDVMSGQVDSMFIDPGPALPVIQAGKVVALGVSSATRMSSSPDIPTIHEGGVKDFEATGWQGIVAPAGTPALIVEKLNAILVAYLQRPDVRTKFLSWGIAIRTSTRGQFEEHIASELKKWAEVTKAAGIEPE